MKQHFIRIYKALAWVSITLGFLVLFSYWEGIFQYRVVVPSIILISAISLFVISPNHFFSNLSFALAVCTLSIGTIEFVIEGGVFALNPYTGYLLVLFTITSVMILVGRYFLVQIILNGWMRKIFRWALVIIGSNEEAKTITDFIVKNDAPYYIKGIITSDAILGLDTAVPKLRLGDVEQLPEIAARNEIDDLVITDERIEKELLLCILDYCIEQRLNVWYSPQISPIMNLKLKPLDLAGLPLFRLCTQRRSRLFGKVKHSLDALITFPLAILVLPLLLIIAVAIKLNSEGPVFYKADMIGKNGNIFKMYKFRTMTSGTDFAIHKEFVTKLIKGEIGVKGVDGQKLKMTEDSRITSVGRFLRRFSLDELPQIFNVIKGEMSLVGPRPCTTYEFEHYQEWHKKRTLVRPGITGLWQVAGRSEVTFEDMILLDLYYVYNRSLLFDFQIMYETIFSVLKQKGAY